MDFSGSLNWGDIVAQIVVHDVELAGDGGTIMNAEVTIDFNGRPLSYRIAPM